MEPDRWLGLDLRHLLALTAIAEEGSFGRAAERLGYTQSAISQQIATLERIVGLRLVERPGGPRPISLTEAGRILVRHAEAIEARLLAAKDRLGCVEAPGGYAVDDFEIAARDRSGVVYAFKIRVRADNGVPYLRGNPLVRLQRVERPAE